MARIVRSPRARTDIIEVLRYTKQRWGDAKAVEYRDLIAEALHTIASDPRCGRSRAAAHPDVLGYHIAQPGRAARHIVFYRLRDDGAVEVVRLLHDSMDFEQHLWVPGAR